MKEFIPEIWSTLLNKTLQKSLVYGSCTNSNYQGEISGKGDKVKILEIGDISIGNYSKGSDIVYEELDDASQILEITQAKYWAFKVDDIEAYQANAALLQPAIDKAAYALKDTIDQYVASFYTEAGITTNLGNDTTPIEINMGNVSDYLVKIARLLDDAYVPRDNRFCVITPWLLEDLVNAKIIAATQNTDLLDNGFITRYAGLDLKLSNNFPNTSSAKYKILAGWNGAISFAQNITKTESIRLEKTFGDGVRGLSCYGAKVIKPGALVCLTANEAADA